MKAIKTSQPLLLSEVEEFKRIVSMNLLQAFPIHDFCFIGSVGKKLESNDVDIAVVGSYRGTLDILNELGFEIKESIGFNIISFGYPFNDKIIQVDLMFTENLEWSEFMYYSPNLMIGESKYKGLYRNMLLSDIAVVESKQWISELDFRQCSIVMNKGLFTTTKTYRSKIRTRPELKNPRILSQEFISHDVPQMLKILRLSDSCQTFEQLYAQVQDRPTKAEITAKFIQSCERLQLEIPIEISNQG